MRMIERFNTHPENTQEAVRPITVGSCVNREPPAKSGVCVVLGGHPCWESDFEEFKKHYDEFDVLALNYCASLMPCDMIGTCHSDLVQDILAHYRKAHPDKPDPELHIQAGKNTDATGDYYQWAIKLVASSAPFSAAALAIMGYDMIVMCGCPMEGEGGHVITEKNTSKVWAGLKPNIVRSRISYMKKFKNQHPDLAGKIRSMSGATKTIFGGL